MKVSRYVRGLSMMVCFGMLVGASMGQEIPRMDGRGNNPNHPDWGAAGAPMVRVGRVAFRDKIGSPGGASVNPRLVSNIVCHQSEVKYNARKVSDLFWVWGQFIDHDIVLMEVGDEFFPIAVPDDDTLMSKVRFIPFLRARPIEGTGTSEDNPRQYRNRITAFIDASNVYGVGDRDVWLRSYEGGKLRVSEGNLMPWNTVDGEFNSPVDPNAPEMAIDFGNVKKYFIAGDVRANENVLLTAMHTLFVREHNRYCEELARKDPSLSDEELFQRGRRWVSALLQHITFDEWLPAIGVHLPEYQGYNPEVNPNIILSFAASAFRMGHSLIGQKFLRLDHNGNPMPQGALDFNDAFFQPIHILRFGIDPFFKGMAGHMMQELDDEMINGLRNFVFEDPHSNFVVGFDLAAINMQRGRDMGIPCYNDLREDFGLPRLKSFEELTDDPKLLQEIQSAFNDVDSIDSWVGLLAEKDMSDKMVGTLLNRILTEQFLRLRDGDRFYYENDPRLSEEEKEEIRRTRLSDIILRNTDIDCIQDSVFIYQEQSQMRCWPVVVANDLDVNILPRIITDEHLVNIYAANDKEVQLKLVAADGSTKWARTMFLTKGENKFRLHFDRALPPGLYLFIVETNDAYKMVRLLK